MNWRDVTHGGNLKTGNDVEFLLCVERGAVRGWEDSLENGFQIFIFESELWMLSTRETIHSPAVLQIQTVVLTLNWSYAMVFAVKKSKSIQNFIIEYY